MSSKNDMTPQEIRDICKTDRFLGFYSVLCSSDEFKVGKFLVFEGLTEDDFDELRFYIPCVVGNKDHLVLSLDSIENKIPFGIIKMLQACYVRVVDGTICN